MVEKIWLKYMVFNLQYVLLGEFRFYLEEFDDDAFANSDLERDIWLYVKFYNLYEVWLSYCGMFYVSFEEMFSIYMLKIKFMVGFVSIALTFMFEEIAFVRESKI